MLSKTIILSFIGFLMSFNLTSAEPYGSHASAKWQIWAYSSAAPSFIGDNATITGSNGETLREGTNGWTCASGNPGLFQQKDGRALTKQCLRATTKLVCSG